ncbi:MAG: hypothetical protein COW00_20315 [Bdellovibrio sp. CG12_big_fil_rev_8_21_14_0_65_39_13]|nr:MAG: hypothetical protein COW78_15525 [Bdellovibrio sp. CG22_combo_CG10-13_8_21_14_all_39_27]PIQ57575.1 MAG: hypothetical protein COW00_20315 [Bdellovibrio sp. CG12_big_fil_rev_8_21_14_0_65_39_13]
MNSEKLKFFFGLLLIGLAGYIYLSNHHLEDQTNDNGEQAQAIDSQNQEVETNEVKEVYAPLPEGKVELAKKLEANSSEIQSAIVDSVTEQELLKTDFQKTIKANVKLPENLKYTQLDLEDGIGGLYGTDASGQNEFAMLGTEKSATLDQIVDYLNNSQGALPQVRNGDFPNRPVIRKITPPSGRGISSIQVIQGKKSSDRMLYAAIVERSDRKGTYVFVMKAPTSFFDTNEGMLDSMLESLQVK